MFLSHSGRDRVAALALQTWLERAEPGLVDEIFLDLDPDTGIPAGVRWKEALRRANERCEAVICLLSQHWDDSHECKVEYRAAEDRGKPIFPGPIGAVDRSRHHRRMAALRRVRRRTEDRDRGGRPRASRWNSSPSALVRLQKGLRVAGIAPDSFAWPPDGDPGRAPYRGWQPLEAVDAAIYFGRDAQINRALSAIRELRGSRGESDVRHFGAVRGGQVVVSAGRAAAPAAPRRPALPADGHRAPATPSVDRPVWFGALDPRAARRSGAVPSRVWARSRPASVTRRGCGAGWWRRSSAAVARFLDEDAGAGAPDDRAAGGSGRGAVRRRRRGGGRRFS